MKLESIFSDTSSCAKYISLDLASVSFRLMVLLACINLLRFYSNALLGSRCLGNLKTDLDYLRVFFQFSSLFPLLK